MQSSSPDATLQSAAAPRRPLAVGVVGATGNVGTMMLTVLRERGIPMASLRAFASTRSAGRELSCGEHIAIVEDLDSADPTGLDVALFSAGAQRALDHAPRFVQAGVTVIDNSSAFRARDDIPLVVPEVNGQLLEQRPQLIANPNCSTIQLVVALKPISDAVGLQRVVVTTFQSVSGTGQAAMEELHEQTEAVLNAGQPSPQVYPHQIAFNVLPHAGDFDQHGNTSEELKLVNESRKIMGLPDLRVAATCTRVPVFTAHSEAVNIQTRAPLSPDACRELLRNAPGVQVVDDPARNEYPMPLSGSGIDEVLVGRIRVDPSVENGLSMFVVGDNLRKGAATNAVQILEALQRVA